jgi:hypothetical protein
MPYHNGDSEIAKLMYACGVSVNMGYNIDEYGGSGAQVVEEYSGEPCAQDSYQIYFQYSDELKGYNRSQFVDSTWQNMIKADLNAGRPVQYCGCGPAGCHTWVCDGYSSSGFHMNWGWSGMSNGYFSLDALNADGDTFNSQEQALFGIHPPAVDIKASIAKATCSATSCDYMISIPGQGGIGPYSFLWDDGETVDTRINLCAGSYSVTVTDAKGNTASQTISVSALTSSIAANDSSGNITETVSGGCAPYTFQWSNGAKTQNLHNVANGTYSVIVTDNSGCVQTNQITIAGRVAGMAALQISDISVYPSPSNGILNINLPVQSAPDKATIIDMTGRTIAEYAVKAGSNNIQLDNIENGVYIIRFSLNGAGIANRRFVLSR